MFTVLTRQPCEQAGLKALSRTPAIVALVVLLLSVVVLVAITLIQIHQKEILLPGPKYGIVLDAGSSRTTVYVYQWPAEKENNTGVVSQTYKCSVKGSGISSYSKNPQDAPEAFEDCMQKVKEQIPAHLSRSTRIYLGATAGMRLLSFLTLSCPCVPVDHVEYGKRQISLLTLGICSAFQNYRVYLK